MVTFWVLGIVLIVVATAAVMVPLARASSGRIGIAAVIFAVPAITIATYLMVGDPRGLEVETADPATAQLSVEDMVARLEQRLVSTPEDAEGWAMLARSYLVMGRYDEAVTAWGNRRGLPGGDTAEVLANHAEAMILAGREIVSEEVRGPLEQTLVLQADHPKALWYGGIAAREAGEPNLAIERWQRLKSLSPPEELLRVLDQEIAATYQAMGVEPPAVVADAPIETLRFDIGISLSPAITTDGEFAALFVLLRRAGGGGPPIAARRLPVDLPVEIVIGPEHAMIAGTSFEDLGSLVLVARLSRSGNAIAASGDLEGRVDIDPGSRVPITVMIDAVVP